MSGHQKLLVAILFMLAAGAAQASLVNGDFGDGLAGWSAQLTSCVVCDGSDDATVDFAPIPQPLPPGLDGALTVGAGGATLATSTEVYSVNLFQTFDMPDVSLIELEVDLSFGLSDPLDFAFAQLVDTSGSVATLDLLAGGVFDVSAFAGRRVELLFGLLDFDFAADSMTVAGVTLTAVPLPAPLLLMLSGLLLALRPRRRA